MKKCKLSKNGMCPVFKDECDGFDETCSIPTDPIYNKITEDGYLKPNNTEKKEVDKYHGMV